MKRSRHPTSPKVEVAGTEPTSDTPAEERCDYCKRPASRLANIGRGEERKRLCPDCTFRAIKRKCRRQ